MGYMWVLYLLLFGVLIIILLISLLIYTIYKNSHVFDSATLENILENVISKIWISLGINKTTTEISIYAEEIKKIASGIKEDINTKIGEISTYTKEIKDIHKNLEIMLKSPGPRGAFGEIVLERILQDHLPPDMYEIRKQIPNGKKPDAYIKTIEGIICIDSKFPLENYIKMIESEDDKEREKYKKAFLKDIKGHLMKIKDSYVSPRHGTLDLAFAFIPSESVYYFLISEAYDTLNAFIKDGVHVVSPLTLAHKLELIKLGIHAKKLSKEAEKIRGVILYLGEEFNKLDKEWNTLNNHLRNLSNKVQQIGEIYNQIKKQFDAVRQQYS